MLRSFNTHLASNSIGVYIASCSVFQLAVVPDVGINSLGAASRLLVLNVSIVQINGK